ncbi:MAG: hypothetical protein AB7H96_24075 [Vicinamibacterales bacterium]
MSSSVGPGSDRARIFLLSPANCSGKRAQMLLSDRAAFGLAARLRDPSGAPLGEVFSFVSGLYFRGKLAYARRFASLPPVDAGEGLAGGIHVITPNAGLRSPDTAITLDAVRSFAACAIDAGNEHYRRPLEQSARMLLDAAGACDVVLLGSIASPKYVDVLLGVFGEQLCFPTDFVGRGDMSRGGLMLRRVASGEELPYAPLGGSVRHGVRPPKLEPLRSSPAAHTGSA